MKIVSNFDYSTVIFEADAADIKELVEIRGGQAVYAVKKREALAEGTTLTTTVAVFLTREEAEAFGGENTFIQEMPLC